MALSSLTLNISACVENACQVLTVRDTTGVYDLTDNPGGWQNAGTVLAASVTAAVLNITLPDGTAMDEIDVLADLPDPITGEFNFPSITLPAKADGKYVIEYTITVGTTSKTKRLSIYSLCNVRCCIDKMWSKYANNINATSDGCGCTPQSTLTKDRATLAETLLKAITSSAMCNNETSRDGLLTKLKRLCALEECNCN